MNFILMPSLEHIALVKVVTTLWNQEDIRALIREFYLSSNHCNRRENWQEIENKVIEKVPQLLQPRPFKEKIANFINAIGVQILKWVEYHFFGSFNFVIPLPNELCWTPQGTVDNKKTAAVLIRDELLDITNRYFLACIYCLTDDILELWNNVPENGRETFCNVEVPNKVRQWQLVIFWTYEIAKMNNMIAVGGPVSCFPHQYAFEYAASGGNKAATDFFLQKLTPRVREEYLVKLASYVAYRYCDFPRSYNSEILCFLLSQMNVKQQTEVFKSCPCEVLNCLLDWPWQGLFMETANHMWDFLPDVYYEFVLKAIINRVMDGNKDFNYQKLFEEFWQQSRDAHKRYVLDRGIVLVGLCKVKDKKSVSLILNDATLEEKERFIFSDLGKGTCESLIYREEWDLVKFFIQECVSSKELTIKFKEEFREHNVSYHLQEELEQVKVAWNKFFQLLDNLIHTDNKKRNMEEGDRSPAKRLCNIELEEITSSMKM